MGLGSTKTYAFFGAVLLCLVNLFAGQAALGQVLYDDIRDELFQGLNDWRMENGRSAAERMALTRDQVLDEIIQLHVEDKAQTCGYSGGGGAHSSCDGRNLGQRVRGQDTSGNPMTGAPNYLEGQSGSVGYGENMAFGARRSRDRVFSEDEVRSIIREDLLRQNSGTLTTPELIEAAEGFIRSAVEDLLTGIGDCSSSTSGFTTRDGVSHSVCQLGGDGGYVEQGFIEQWARSPGHRRNMLGAWGAAGVGYDEGLLRVGGSSGPLSGQLFGIQVRMAGFRAAAGMSDDFQLGTEEPTVVPVLPPAPEPPPPGTTPPPPPPGVVVPMPEVIDPMLERPPVTETSLPVMNDNERQLARAFLGLTEGDMSGFAFAEGEEAALIRIATAFAALPSAQDLVSALDQVAPTANQAVIDSGPLLGLSASWVMGRRLSALRLAVSGRPATARPGPASTVRRSVNSLLAAATPPLAQVAAATPTGSGGTVSQVSQGGELVKLLGLSSDLLDSKARSRGGPWSQVYVGHRDRSRDGLYQGYDQNQYTWYAGLDHRLRDRAWVGVLGGVGKLDADFDAGAGENEAYHYLGGIYASWLHPSHRGYLNALLNVGYIDYEQSRRIRIGNEIQFAEGDSDSWLLGGSVGAGLLFHLRNVVIEPDLAVYYNHQRTSALQERGSVLRLNVDKRRTNTWILSTGLNLSSAIEAGGGVLQPSIGMHYLREDPLDSRTFSSTFAVAPNLPEARFGLEGRSDVRHYYQQDVGFEWQVQQHFYMRGDYQFITGSRLEDHLLSLGLRYEFQ